MPKDKEQTSELPPVAERVGFGSNPKATVEHWAAKKGHIPQPFGQARMLKGWVEGAELTEQEYDAAVADVANVRHG